MPMRARSLAALNPGGFHRITYTEWGAPERPALVCVHGMTRNGRDFDVLAAALESDWRIVCPDVVGRGRSDWLTDHRNYGYPQYLADMTALLARLDVDGVDWVGTSMGGLIGMMLAAQPGTPIRRLVINDIGPFIPKAFLERLRDYVGKDPHFADLTALERYLREVHAPFGALDDNQWRHLAEHSARPLPGGGFGLAYDPAIARAAFTAEEPEDVEMWEIWERVACPVLVLRGAESDLLLPETVARMTASKPGCEIAEIEGCGHAPALMDESQISLIRTWLER
ncbi:MAG: alpha/beta hydrolase [Rhodospirillales bacterium]|nr:MAG: alpha/beta hydrolase [Rhodospirillales bacterium]